MATHNQMARKWREQTAALAESMDSLLGKKVRVTTTLWGEDLVFTGTVSRINAMPSSVFGKSLSVEPDDPKEAHCGTMTGLQPQNIEVLR